MSRHDVRSAAWKVQAYGPQLGDFRRAEPKNAPKLFKMLHSEAKAHFDALAQDANTQQRSEVALLHACHGFQEAIKRSGFDPEQVAPATMQTIEKLRQATRAAETANRAVRDLLRGLLHSDELTTAMSPVVK